MVIRTNFFVGEVARNGLVGLPVADPILMSSMYLYYIMNILHIMQLDLCHSTFTN